MIALSHHADARYGYRQAGVLGLVYQDSHRARKPAKRRIFAGANCQFNGFPGLNSGRREGRTQEFGGRSDDRQIHGGRAVVGQGNGGLLSFVYGEALKINAPLRIEPNGWGRTTHQRRILKRIRSALGIGAEDLHGLAHRA